MRLTTALGPGMTPTASRLSWMIQKKRHLFHSFVQRRAPEFVYRRSPRPPEGEIPVFTFHGVVPETFEAQCAFLARNGYRTLSAEEFRRCMNREEELSDPSVLLTFDDGMKQVWTVAHPILEKYGLKAACFLIPGCMSGEAELVRPTLRDVRAGSVAEETVVAIHPEEPPLATWGEVSRMHASGVFSFHSHTMYHALVPASERVFTFVSPRYNPYFFGNIHIPLYTANGTDVLDREPVAGLPVFYSRPRMQAARRFFPSEDLLHECTALVKDVGVEAFFQDASWKGKLRDIVTRHRRRTGGLGRWETKSERDRSVREELEQSRRSIRHRLPGAEADQLCFPWFSGLPFSVEAALDVGFNTIYFGQLSDRPTNRPGQALHRIARIDDVYLERLPGEGRMSLSTFMTSTAVNALSKRHSVSRRLFASEVS